jgi:hypothetical protein
MRLLFALLLMSSLLPAHAQEATERQKLDWWAYQLAVAEAPGDVYSDLLIAKSMRFHQKNPHLDADSDEAGALRARAEVIAAELQARADSVRDTDPFLLVMDLGCWPEIKSALCQERRARLEAFAPDNAYLGMVLMAYAWMAQDAEGYQRAARLAATAERYDSQLANAFGALRKRYRGVPVPAMAGGTEQNRRLAPEVMAMSMAAAVAMPPVQHFSQPCRESEGELREHCLAVALKMMSQSQNLIEINIARSVVEALGTAEDIESARMIQRDVDWLVERSIPFSAAMDHADVPGTQEFFDAYASDGELSALRALLTAHNIPIHPPEGWTKD